MKLGLGFLSYRAWLERGNDVFRRGGARASDVEALIQQSHQLMWGDDDIQAGVPQMVARLKEAQAWAQQVRTPPSSCRKL
jgi:hypothetical protein